MAAIVPSGAAFKIGTSLYADRGYDATNSEVLSLQIEASPALDVGSCIYSVLVANTGAPALTFSNGGLADPPTTPVTVTMPASGAYFYIIQCQTNGGALALDPSTGKPSAAINTKYRGVAIRTGLGLRKTVVIERDEYDPLGSWAELINEMVEIFSTLGGVPGTRTVTAGAGLTGGGTLAADRTFDVGANADGSIVVNANDVQVGVLASDAQHGVRGGGTQHAAVIAAGASGFMTGADKTKLDGLPTSAVSTATTVTAGAGLTGGGDLSANRTFNVVANADASIVVNADDIQVGVISDAQHGTRGGGTTHAVAIASGAAGFLSGADKAKLDGLPSSAVSTTRTISTTAPLTGGGDLSADRTLAISAASGGAAGSMSAAHYTLVNGATAAATADTLLKRGASAEAIAAWFAPAASGVASVGVVRGAASTTLLAVAGAVSGNQNVIVTSSDEIMVGDVAKTAAVHLTTLPGGYVNAKINSLDILVASEDGVGHGNTYDFGHGVRVASFSKATTSPDHDIANGFVLYGDTTTGDAEVWVKGMVRWGVAPEATGTLATTTRCDILKKIARKQTTDGSTVTLWAVTPGATESLRIRLYVEGRYSDLWISEERVLRINRAAGAPTLTATTVGTDLNTIGGTAAVSYAYTGGDVRVVITGNNPNTITWKCTVHELEIFDP